jgi:TATA-binding protein-associated factor Taf7
MSRTTAAAARAIEEIEEVPPPRGAAEDQQPEDQPEDQPEAEEDLDMSEDDDQEDDEDQDGFEDDDYFDLAQLSQLLVTEEGEPLADVLKGIRDALDKHNKILFRLVGTVERLASA